MDKTVSGYRPLSYKDYDKTMGRYTRFGKRTQLADGNLIADLRVICAPYCEKITRTALRKRKRIEKYGC